MRKNAYIDTPTHTHTRAHIHLSHKGRHHPQTTSRSIRISVSVISILVYNHAPVKKWSLPAASIASVRSVYFRPLVTKEPSWRRFLSIPRMLGKSMSHQHATLFLRGFLYGGSRRLTKMIAETVQ